MASENRPTCPHHNCEHPACLFFECRIVNAAHRRTIMEASETAARSFKGPVAREARREGVSGSSLSVIFGHALLRRAVVFRSRTIQKRTSYSAGPSKGRKVRKVFPGHATFGAPPSLKNTEKTVPDGFFLTSNMYKIYFRGPRWGSLRRSPRPPVGLSDGRRLDLGVYGMRL